MGVINWINAGLCIYSCLINGQEAAADSVKGNYSKSGLAEQIAPSSVEFHLSFPAIREMYNKLASSIMWVNDHIKNTWCDKAVEGQVVECGGKQLMDVWLKSSDDSSSQSKTTRLQPVGDVFQYRIEQVCRKYRHYKDCIAEKIGGEVLEKCTSLAAIGVHVMYDYICQPDNYKVVRSGGECLSSLPVSKIANNLTVSTNPICREHWITDAMQTFVTLDWHKSATRAELAAALQQHIAYVCSFWERMRTCYAPTIKSICGKSAVQLFEGMQAVMREVMIQVYSPLGQKLADAVKCKSTQKGFKTGEHGTLTKELINKQVHLYQVKYSTAVENSCRCSATSIEAKKTYCVWNTLAKVDWRAITQLDNMQSAYELFCHNHNALIPMFLHCFRGATDDCALNRVLNITDTAIKTCAAVNAARRNLPCFLLMTSYNPYLIQCDMTLGGFVQFVMLQSSMIVRKQSAHCDSSALGGSTSAFPVSSCIANVVAKTGKTSLIQDTCGKFALDAILGAIQAISAMLDGMERFEAHLFQSVCSGNYTECTQN